MKNVALKYIGIVFAISIGLLKTASAQDILTLEEAKTMALQQNYRVQIGANSVNIAKSSTQIARAAYKPTFGVNAGVSGNLSNSNFKYSINPERVVNWVAPSLNANIGASANYILWDAHNRDHQVAQSIANEKLVNIAFQSTKESIVYSVENTYLNTARLYENRNLLEASIAISQKRKLRAQYSFDYGSSDKLALLNATVDLNRDSVDLLKFNQNILNAKRNLNLILNRDVKIDYQVETKLKIDENLTFEYFFTSALQNNLVLQQARQDLNISAYDKKINDSNLKPFIMANASYGINFQNNRAIGAFVQNSLTDALNLGLSATWNIADGGRTKQLNQLAALKISSQQLAVNQLEDQISLEITNAWGEYQNALLVYELEQKSVEIAIENFVRTEEKFKNGLVNSITFRQAQLNLLFANLNLSSAKYDAKLIELDLKQLSGGLL